MAILDGPTNVSGLLRKFTQEDMLASGIRMALSVAGSMGEIAGEFLTHFVPGQRIDRLQDFVEKLSERLAGVEDRFKERLASSAGFAALSEQAFLSAVRTPSAEHRRDLVEILHRGLTRDEAEMIEQQSLLALRDRLNDSQVLILMSHGSFSGTFNDPEHRAFLNMHSELFVLPPTMNDSEDVHRRWTMFQHYEGEMETMNLLQDTDGVAKSSSMRHYRITRLGHLLLEAIGRLHSQGKTDATVTAKTADAGGNR